MIKPLINTAYKSIFALLVTSALVSTQAQAAMYKYLLADGQTLLTGEKLKGNNHKLVKTFKIKKLHAYKSSESKKKKTARNKASKQSKKSKSKKSQRKKVSNKLYDPKGRVKGRLTGCGDNSHLSKQARIYKKPIEIYSRIYNVEAELIHAIVKQESCFNEEALSYAGAIGLMQLMPQTALGLKISNPWNPEHNIQGGIKYISKMLKRFDGNYKLAIAAYNAGPGNVRKYKGIPPFKETRNYVVKVYKEYKRLKKVGLNDQPAIQIASN